MGFDRWVYEGMKKMEKNEKHKKEKGKKAEINQK